MHKKGILDAKMFISHFVDIKGKNHRLERIKYLLRDISAKSLSFHQQMTDD